MQGLTAVAGLGLSAAIAFNLLGNDEPAPTPGPTGSAGASEPAVGMDEDALAQSVVLVQAMSGDSILWWGSGTVVSDDGLILTNAHVVTPELEGQIDSLVVGVTDRTDAAPTPRYTAEVVAADAVLDLAVIRPTGTIGGGPYDGALVAIPLGDSAAVGIGDDLSIVGYPGIGGDTVTFTGGQVSGFTSDDVLGDRAWIKTDATLAGGNSGGLAADADGRLIGVPTLAAAGEDVGDIVDCRPVVDTNRDGVIDANDDCVPIGGFLNGVRPINLALDLIDAVSTGVAYEPIGGLPDPVVDPNPVPADFDATAASFERPRFTDVQPEDQAPDEDLLWLASGATQLCGWWEFAGMADGVTWDALWALDGDLQEDISYLGEVWTGGESGNWWVCFTSEEGIVDGIWDLTLNVEGELRGGSFVGVGDQLTPVEVTVSNDGPETICYLYVSPATSTFWGSDWLGTEQVIEPDNGVTLELPPATYDLMGQDCSGNELFTDQQEIIATTDLTY